MQDDQLLGPCDSVHNFKVTMSDTPRNQLSVRNWNRISSESEWLNGSGSWVCREASAEARSIVRC